MSRISIRMLRHYDAIGLLVPAEVDDFTGYRYYSEEQLPRAGRIQTLKCMGFGLTAIGDILKKHQNAEEMERFLLDRRAELEGQERIIQERLYFLDNAIKRLRKEGRDAVGDSQQGDCTAECASGCSMLWTCYFP